MKSQVLFDNGTHKWIVLGRDPEKSNEIIDTNQYIVMHGEEAVMLDPGGIEIFPQVLTETTTVVKTENIKGVIASHQDPDIASSLAMWLELCPGLKVYCSNIWTGFLAHFGMGTKMDLIGVADEGRAVQIGTTDAQLYMIPAHYCHSSGNFSVYDPISKILFSGDIGAALLPDANAPFFVDDFDNHLRYIEMFHRRWMPSSVALKKWVARVRRIQPEMIASQHGSIYRGEAVHHLLDWLDHVEVGQTNDGAEAQGSDKAAWMA